MSQLELFADTSKTTTTIKKQKTSKRLHTWTVQKKEGGRWRTLVDSQGVITIKTRKLARNISREYNNTASKPRSYRVKKLS